MSLDGGLVDDQKKVTGKLAAGTGAGMEGFTQNGRSCWEQGERTALRSLGVQEFGRRIVRAEEAFPFNSV